MRKQILSAALVMMALSLFGGSACATDAKPGNKNERMNVLFLIVDDLNTWLLSDPDRYTGKVIAPNIVRLAQSGVNFKYAYTASPKCSPSRTAFLSGVAPWKSGVYENGHSTAASPALKDVIPLMLLLKNAGYYTAGSGKISHGYPDRGWWHKSVRHGWRVPPPPGAPLNGLNKRITEQDWGPAAQPESEMGDTKNADFAIEQLKKKHDRPFLISCGIFHPHFPWYVPQKYLDMYPLEKIAIPSINPKDQADIPDAGKKLIRSGLLEKAVKAGQQKKMIQGYLASTTYADVQIGRVLEALANSPYANNTIVILISDHGFHVGEKQHVAKGTLWEEATHSLLMMRVPGMTKAKGICTSPVSLLDVYPTLVELTGVAPPKHHLDGTSLVPQLKNPDTARRKPAIMAFDEHISVRAGQYRYIRYKDGSDELYDRAKDPREWKNLSADPKSASIKSKLNGLLPKPDEMSPAMPSLRGKRKNKKQKRKGNRKVDDTVELRISPLEMLSRPTVGWANPSSLNHVYSQSLRLKMR
ncbi:MAG: sulfatase [Gemmataceae bacterium]